MEEKFRVECLKAEKFKDWLDHVTTVFTTTSRKYFEDHMLCDPDSDFKAIWIAVESSSNKIVSTVKIFKRRLMWQQKTLTMGGIGEVSTQIEYRGKGLAKLLLQKCINYMEEHSMLVSSLHTGSAAPLYASVGWKAVHRYSVSIPFDQFIAVCKDIVASETETFHAHQFTFDNDEKLQKIAKIYEDFNSQFNGPLVRSIEYWKRWIVEETKYAMILEDSKQNILGYASMCPYRKNPKEFCLRDMCVNDKAIVGRVFLAHCILHCLKYYESQEASVAFATIDLPAPIVYKFFPTQPWPFESEEQIDKGYMYRLIADSSSPELKDIDLFTLNEKHMKETHLFWDIDAF